MPDLPWGARWAPGGERGLYSPEYHCAAPSMRGLRTGGGVCKTTQLCRAGGKGAEIERALQNI